MISDDSLKARVMVSILGNNVFFIEVCTLSSGHNAIAHAIDYSAARTKPSHVPGSQNAHLTRFTVILTLCSGVETNWQTLQRVPYGTALPSTAHQQHLDGMMPREQWAASAPQHPDLGS